ncbi:MAG: hypothetical protein ACLFUJ_09340 [Phycisphaerae bacterium]
MKQNLWIAAAAGLGLCLLAPMGGCTGPGGLETRGGRDEDRLEVPQPIDRMLPERVEFHPFTESGVRTFDNAGGLKGIETRVRAMDAFGDSTKAYGHFRFELYGYDPSAIDHRGKRGPTWDIDLMDPQTNSVHWDEISRSYKFLLQWDNAIPIGQRYVLRVVFASPFTQTLDDEKVYVAGQ